MAKRLSVRAREHVQISADQERRGITPTLIGSSSLATASWIIGICTCSAICCTGLSACLVATSTMTLLPKNLAEKKTQKIS